MTVLLVLGILGGGIITFIGDSTNGYAATGARARLADDAQSIVALLSDNIREALPNSVRANTECLEFVPVAGGSWYQTLPIASPSNGFYAWPVEPLLATTGQRAAVYPQSDLYALANPGAISTDVTISAPDSQNRVRIEFSTPFAFRSGAPKSNFYLVTDPVSYCTSSGTLYRYKNYGFRQTQPTVAQLPSSLPNRAVVGKGVSTVFRIAEASLRSSSSVALSISIESKGELVSMNHLVHIRNAP